MKIGQIYSHLNGLEWLLVHRKQRWSQIKKAISNVNANKCKTKRSKEKTMRGKMLFSPPAINAAFKKEFTPGGWKERRVYHAVCDDPELSREVLGKPHEDQVKIIEKAGRIALNSQNQIDFVADDIAIEVQLGKYPFIEYDLFVKHMAFYVSGEIKVGIEIIPMKSLQAQMSSGPGYFESTIYNIVRQGRSVPAVPLVVIGVKE